MQKGVTALKILCDMAILEIKKMDTDIKNELIKKIGEIKEILKGKNGNDKRNHSRN